MSLLLEDRALLARFRAGERKALETVYQHYAPKVSGMVAKGLSGRSPFEVGALVQEVFARAFSQGARDGYTGLTPYVAYLAAIARNLLLNERRFKEHAADAEAIDRALGGGPDSGVVLSTQPGPDEIAESNELTRLIEAFLAQRSEPERKLFKERFVDQKTQDEAAAALGLSRIQVRRMEAYLRKDLLERFKAAGYLEKTTAHSSLLPHGQPEAGQ